MKTTTILLLTLLAGCASTTNCGSDWYAIGERDGLLGAPFQAEQYAGQCTTMDTARYDEGFRVAYARRPLPTW